MLCLATRYKYYKVVVPFKTERHGTLTLSLSLSQRRKRISSGQQEREGFASCNQRKQPNSSWALYLPSQLSFKDKLVGEILGAYSQAFAFSDQMEAKSDSDEEIKEVREDLASVSLLKETKQRIRASWAKALIVKVFGKIVRYNFPHLKLMGLWKPIG